MRLDEADRGGVDPRGGECALIDGNLRLLRRRRDVGGAAILIGRGAAQDAQNAIPVALGIHETFEEQDDTTLAGDGSVRRGVKSAAPARRR